MKPGNHPTGIAGTLTAVVMLVLRKLGVSIDADIAIAIGAIVTALVSLVTPRVTEILHISFTPEDKGGEE